MRWNSKTKKMFIFIVSLLFILQAVAILGSAIDPTGEEDPLDNLGIPDESGDIKDDSSDENIEEDALLGTNDKSSSESYYTPPSYFTGIVSPLEETSNDILSDQKYVTYESALSAALISEEPDPILTSYYDEETSVLEVTVTSEEGEGIPDATVTLIGKKLTTDVDGIIQASIPKDVVENSNNILIVASTNYGHFASVYAPLYEEEQVNTEGGYRAFIQTIRSQALKNVLLAVI